MGDRPGSRDEERPDEGRRGEERQRASNEREELRTIAFRLREIQRLLGARVEQENRRLEAEGVEPVTDHGFFHPDVGAGRARGGGSDRREEP